MPEYYASKNACKKALLKDAINANSLTPIKLCIKFTQPKMPYKRLTNVHDAVEGIC